MRADSSDRLRAASRERAERTLARAAAALDDMESGTVTVARLAAAAGVSRSWIYTQPELLERITLAAGGSLPAKHPPVPAAQRASTTSLRRRLELALQRVQQLTAENQLLRDELARAYGRLREHA